MAPLVALMALSATVGCAGSNPDPKSAVQARQSGEELFNKGRAAFLHRDHARAEQYLKMALDDAYEPRETVTLLIQVCLADSRVRGALNYAEPFLLQHPREDALRFLVATLQLSLGHNDDARHQLERLIHHNPEYADAYFLRGQLRMSDMEQGAKRDLLHYLELAPRGRHAAEVRSLLADIDLARPAPTRVIAAISPSPQGLEVSDAAETSLTK